MKLVLFSIISVVIIQLQLVATKSISEGEDSQNPTITKEQVNYLIHFGYLDSQNVRSKRDISQAIKDFQHLFSLPVTGIIDDATLKLMQAPRCGNADKMTNKERYELYPLGGWKKRHLTYHVFNVTSDLNLDRAAYLVQMSLDMWGYWSKLTFARSNDETNSDIVLSFLAKEHGDGYPFDDERGTLAHAFYPHTRLQGKVHLYETKKWTFHTPENKEGYDFFSVILHELGHTLGMMHSYTEEAIMYPIYKNLEKDSSLYKDDIDGITELYRSS